MFMGGEGGGEDVWVAVGGCIISLVTGLRSCGGVLFLVCWPAKIPAGTRKNGGGLQS